MAQYKYKAQDSNGKLISGRLLATDKDELHTLLRNQNLYMVSASEVEEKSTNSALKSAVLGDFCRQLSTLLSAGVTLVRAIGIIARADSVKPKVRKIYENLTVRIKQGMSLSDALEIQNGAFPPLMIHMFRAAEVGGNLDKVTMKMATIFEKEHKLNQKMSTSMAYPKFLGVMVIAVIFIITKVVLPKLSMLFDQMATLPLSTRILIGLGDIMDKYWLIVLIAIAAIIVGCKALMKNQKFRYLIHKLQIKMPVIGNLNRVVCTSRFAQTLSSLYSAGIPIVQSLAIARKTVGNDYIDEQFDEVITTVRAGNTLSESLEHVDGFVTKLCDTIRVGEETGSLDTMLSSMAESMEYDADTAITKMTTYVEPVMLMIMGLIVAFLLVAIFGALYGSYDSIGAGLM